MQLMSTIIRSSVLDLTFGRRFREDREKVEGGLGFGKALCDVICTKG